MGFWSQVTGTDAISAAVNAVYMEHLLAAADPAARERILERAIPFVQRALPGNVVSAADATLFFNRQHRAVQLNILACVAIELGIGPAIPGAKAWFEVRNAAAALPAEDIARSRVRDAERLIQSDHGIAVRVPDEPMTLQAPVDDPVAQAMQALDDFMASQDFDEHHDMNDVAYDEGEADLPQYLAEFRRLLIAEVRTLTDRR